MLIVSMIKCLFRFSFAKKWKMAPSNTFFILFGKEYEFSLRKISTSVLMHSYQLSKFFSM